MALETAPWRRILNADRRASLLIGECTSDIGVHVHRNAIFMCAPALPYVAGCLAVAARPPERRRRSGAFGRRRERPPSPRAWCGFGGRCVFTPLPPSLGVAPDPSIPTREGGLSAASRRRITRSPTGRPSGSRASPSKAGVPPMARATAQAAKSGTRPSQVTDGLPARDCWTGATSRRRVDGRAHPT